MGDGTTTESWQLTYLVWGQFFDNCAQLSFYLAAFWLKSWERREWWSGQFAQTSVVNFKPNISILSWEKAAKVGCNLKEVDPWGVNFLKITLNYWAWCQICWLLFLVKKLSAKNIFWHSTTLPEKAVKKLGPERNSWAQVSRNWWYLFSLFN